MTKPPTSSPSIQSFWPPTSLGFHLLLRPEPRWVKPPGTLMILPPMRPTKTPPLSVRPSRFGFQQIQKPRICCVTFLECEKQIVMRAIIASKAIAAAMPMRRVVPC